MANKVMKRKYVIGLLVLLAMATVSTYAWSYNESTTDPAKVYATGPSNALLSIDTTTSAYKIVVYGKNEFDITFACTNEGITPVDVQFEFIKTNGDIMTPATATVQIGADRAAATAASTLTETDGIYTLSGLDTGSYTIRVYGTDCVGSLAGGQPFQGAEFIIP